MFSKNLKYLREKNNFEQLELANLLGRKSASTICEWESGKYTPKIGVLSDIAKIFNVDIDDLLNIDLENNKNNALSISTIYNQLESERQENVLSYAKFQLEEQEKSKVIPIKDKSYLEVNAAHHRTDIDVTDEMKKHDDDIMDDENF